VRAFIQCWAMRALALFISAVSLCAQAEAAGTLYEKLEGSFDATGEPMRVRAVHSGRAGCATGCAEWISAEGMMVQGSAQLFGIVVNSLRGRKIPILIHSHGGTVVEAMLIGRLIRARGLDVAVARTDFDPCSDSSGGCKAGSSGALGRPSSEPADCFSACTFVLAGGVHRSLAPGVQLGVTFFRFPESQIEIWRKDYGGKMPFEDFLQLEMLPERKPWITRYFEKMGIAAEITDIMYSTRSGDIRILTETELTRLKLVTDLKGGQSLLEQLTK
jgi:hypothetical protein